MTLTKWWLIGMGCLSLVSVPLMSDATSTASQGQAGFIENDSVVPPVDPTDPDKPIIPDKPGTKGPLSLDAASDYQFGNQKMSDKTMSYAAELAEVTVAENEATKKVPHFIELTDNRGGETGWRLEVRQNAPFQTKAGAALKGTTLTFSTITAVSLTGGGTAPAVPTEAVKVLSESTQNVSVVTATAGTGGGSWGILFGTLEKGADEGVQLTIPGNTKKEEGLYQTTLTWTLVDSI